MKGSVQLRQPKSRNERSLRCPTSRHRRTFTLWRAAHPQGVPSSLSGRDLRRSRCLQASSLSLASQRVHMRPCWPMKLNSSPTVRTCLHIPRAICMPVGPMHLPDAVVLLVGSASAARGRVIEVSETLKSHLLHCSPHPRSHGPQPTHRGAPSAKGDTCPCSTACTTYWGEDIVGWATTCVHD